MTGSIMRWFYFWPLSWRSGATFVHELVAYLFVAVVLAHLYMALTHPHALKSIFTGRVSRAWAERNAKAWAEELAALSCSQGAVASEIPNPPAGEGAKGDKP
jgi:formate dehydrogenase subunit gamma